MSDYPGLIVVTHNSSHSSLGRLRAILSSRMLGSDTRAASYVNDAAGARFVVWRLDSGDAKGAPHWVHLVTIPVVLEERLAPGAVGSFLERGDSVWKVGPLVPGRGIILFRTLPDRVPGA